MSYNFYSAAHLILILALALSIGGLWGLYAHQGLKPSSQLKSFLLSLHGLSSFLIFVAGFGLIAKLKVPFPWPWWIYVKLLIWLFLSFSPFVIRKARSQFKSPKLYISLWLCLMMAFLLPVLIIHLK